jgi:hypothetical protein
MIDLESKILDFLADVFYKFSGVSLFAAFGFLLYGGR